MAYVKLFRCLTTGCKRPSHTRGLCSCCYAAARKLVLDGTLTWEALEARNLSKPLGEDKWENLEFLSRGLFMRGVARSHNEKPLW